MGYGGHAYDMIQRVKQNQELKRRKWERHNKIAEINRDGTYKNLEFNPEDLKKLTSEEKAHYRAIAMKTRRANRFKTVIALLIAVIIVAGLLVIFS
jgi:hypothetical protein